MRLETISANLANQNTLLDAQGNYAPWKRRQVEFAVGDPASGSRDGVHVAAIREIDAWDLRLEPGNPWADASGYVRYPDVDPVTEQVDAMDAVRSYEANIAAVEATKSMFASAIQLLA